MRNIISALQARLELQRETREMDRSRSRGATRRSFKQRLLSLEHAHAAWHTIKRCGMDDGDPLGNGSAVVLGRHALNVVRLPRKVEVVSVRLNACIKNALPRRRQVSEGSERAKAKRGTLP